MEFASVSNRREHDTQVRSRSQFGDMAKRGELSLCVAVTINIQGLHNYYCAAVSNNPYEVTVSYGIFTFVAD